MKLNRQVFIFILLIVFILLSGQANTETETGWMITTIAGNGTCGYSGDGGPATLAQLNKPTGIAISRKGVLYIADSNNHRIYKIDKAGIITTIAGDGTQGYYGDGGQLNHPRGLALDNRGHLYMADSQNHVIRKITPLGFITTIAGNNTPGYCCDNRRATMAQLNYPVDIVIDDANNLYIAESRNHVIRKVDNQGIITTVAGDGIQGNGTRCQDCPATRVRLSHPQSIALDRSGHLYIADYGNHIIRKVNQQGNITTVAGNATRGDSGDGGLATLAQLNFPAGIAIDNRGNLYITDTENYRLRQRDLSGNLTTIAGNGTQGDSGDNGIATAAQINVAFYVTVDNYKGDLYLADTDNRRIRKLNRQAKTNTKSAPIKGM